MSESLSALVEQAIEQAAALHDLDAPRAEVWASDLMAMAAEVVVGPPEALLLHVLDSTPGVQASVVAAAVRAVSQPSPGIAGIAGIAETGATAGAAATGEAGETAESGESGGSGPDVPGWLSSLGTSRCDGAWIFTNRRGVSAVFRFADSSGAGHALAIDLIPGHPEMLGDITVGPSDVVELAEDPDVDLHVEPHDPIPLARRVADAMSVTERPSESLVINGRLIVARLSTLVDHSWVVPVRTVDEVPDLPERNPDDNAFALDVLDRALGQAGSESVPAPEGVAVAADRLRVAARSDGSVAQWLAASRGPVDLDEPDDQVVLAALAASVAPSRMEPLDGDAREAVAILEWADWLGVVLGLVREGEGAAAASSHLVDLINSCPEVTSSIPKSDRQRVEWALEVCGQMWQEIGVSREGQLTEAGIWALPRALRYAWNPDFGD